MNCTYCIRGGGRTGEVGGGLHLAMWNDLLRLQARDIATRPHTTLLDEREANEQST